MKRLFIVIGLIILLLVSAACAKSESSGYSQADVDDVPAPIVAEGGRGFGSVPR